MGPKFRTAGGSTNQVGRWRVKDVCELDQGVSQLDYDVWVRTRTVEIEGHFSEVRRQLVPDLQKAIALVGV